MRVLVEGRKPKAEWPKKFKCRHCESILEAEVGDLKYLGCQYNAAVWQYVCPVCGQTAGIDDDDFMEE